MPHKYQTAVIFAGGKSSRMGRDKSLLPFGNDNSMCEYLYKKLALQFDSVHISAKSNKFGFDADIIIDKYAQSSPMVALVSIFETIQSDEIFILSVDSPLITQEIIGMLYKHASENINAEAIIAVSPNGIEPMCGIYRRGVYRLAKEYLENDMHQLMKLLKNSNVKYVVFNENEEFANLNSPSEYEEALSKL